MGSKWILVLFAWLGFVEWLHEDLHRFSCWEWWESVRPGGFVVMDLGMLGMEAALLQLFLPKIWDFWFFFFPCGRGWKTPEPSPGAGGGAAGPGRAPEAGIDPGARGDPAPLQPPPAGHRAGGESLECGRDEPGNDISRSSLIQGENLPGMSALGYGMIPGRAGGRSLRHMLPFLNLI